MLYDALIVGFGPVGATLANLLAHCGLRAAVAEAEYQVYDKPRALTFDHEAMRLFQSCGLAQRIEPFTAPHRGTHFLGMDGQVIKKFEPMAPPFPLSWSPTLPFVQPQLERILREAASTSTALHVLLGHALVDFTQYEDRVEAIVRDRADGRERTLAARFLLGCDGANSFVRKRIDSAIEDLGFDEWWMVVDVLIDSDVELPPRSIQYCWPSRPSTFVPGPGRLRRWEIKLLPGEDPEAFGRPENVVAQIARFVDPARVQIWRSAVYRFHALLAQRWRERRVFLVGDACHQTPPFLGQGMCAGVRDAANLAWKLAMVLQDGACDQLLDTYEEERKPHVRQLVATAKEFGLVIGELDAHAARVRDALLRGQLERGEAETVRQRFVPNLSGGIIDRTPDALAAGTLFVQPKVRRMQDREAVLLDDLLRPRFLIATTSASVLSGLSAEAREIWRGIHGEQLVIGTALSEHSDVIETDGLFAHWMRE